MNTAIIYCSFHHQNTKKVVDYISENINSDVFSYKECENISFDDYDNIIIASGIYSGDISKEIKEIVFNNIEILKNKKIHLVITAGLISIDYTSNFESDLKEKGITLKSKYQCRGYDTCGPWKLINGMNVGHPSEKELKEALNNIIINS